MGNKNLNITSQLIKNLEVKLKKELKEKYKGMWSVAVRLVNQYFTIHNNSEEFMYFTDYKALVLAWELTDFLDKNIPDWKDKNFDYEKVLNQSEKELEQTKVTIYNRWINNDLNRILLDFKLKSTLDNKNVRLKYKIEMLEDLIKRFPKYTKENDWEFKEAIGL